MHDGGGFLVIAHSDEGAMPQLRPICPFDERDLADQLWLKPSAFLHLLGRERLSPAGRLLLGQVGEGATRRREFLEQRENLVAITGHEAIPDLRHVEQTLGFINADEQRIKAVCAGHVAGDDKLLLAISALLDPRPGAISGFVQGAVAFADHAFES